MKTLICIVIAIMQIHILYAQKKSKEMIVGLPAPELAFNNVINYPKNDILLSELKGKSVILTFWGVHCIPCIQSLPKLEALQSKFKNELIIFTIATIPTGKEQPTVDFYLKREQRNEKITLTGIIDSTIWKELHVPSTPHYVWVDASGIVKAVTSAEEMTDENVLSFIRNEQLNFNMKKNGSAEIVNHDHQMPFFLPENEYNKFNLQHQSVLTKYIEGKRGLSYMPWVTNKIFALNVSIRTLYEMAYYDVGFDTQKRIVLEVTDTTRYNKKENSDNYDIWKLENTYCYELIVPVDKSDQTTRIMKDDLKRYFDLNVKVEKRRTKCLILTRIGSNNFQATGNEKMERHSDPMGIVAQNTPMSTFTTMLQRFYYKGIFLDETNWKKNVNIAIDANMINMQEVNRALQMYGLNLVEDYRDIEFLIVSESNMSLQDSSL